MHCIGSQLRRCKRFFLHLRNLLETSLGNNFPPELRLSKRVSDMLFLFLVSVTKLSPSAGLVAQVIEFVQSFFEDMRNDLVPSGKLVLSRCATSARGTI